MKKAQIEHLEAENHNETPQDSGDMELSVPALPVCRSREKCRDATTFQVLTKVSKSTPTCLQIPTLNNSIENLWISVVIENYRCLILHFLHLLFQTIPDSIPNFFSLYVQKLRLCTLCCYGNRRASNSLCISKAVSLYAVDFDN